MDTEATSTADHREKAGNPAVPYDPTAVQQTSLYLTYLQYGEAMPHCSTP